MDDQPQLSTPPDTPQRLGYFVATAPVGAAPTHAQWPIMLDAIEGDVSILNQDALMPAQGLSHHKRNHDAQRVLLSFQRDVTTLEGRFAQAAQMILAVDTGDLAALLDVGTRRADLSSDDLATQIAAVLECLPAFYFTQAGATQPLLDALDWDAATGQAFVAGLSVACIALDVPVVARSVARAWLNAHAGVWYG